MIRRFPEPIFVSYTTKGKALALLAGGNHQNNCFNLRAANNSGSSANVGLMRNFVTGKYSLYSYVNSGPTYTNVTSSIGSGANIFTGTNNDGFVFQAERRTGLLGMTITTTTTGGTFTYKYWNGSSFVTLNTMEVPAYTTAGDIWIVAMPPSDWVVGGPTGLDPTKYAIQVISTTAPSGVVTINNLWAGEFLEFIQGVPNNGIVQLSFPDSKPMVLNGTEGVFPYFSAPSNSNSFGAYFALT